MIFILLFTTDYVQCKTNQNNRNKAVITFYRNIEKVVTKGMETMKLQIKNIGKINDAVIEFNGITVIAGENNTGKSTVGKALFALCNTFYDLDRKIKTERRSSVENALSLIYLRSGKRPFMRLEENVLAGKLIKKFAGRENEITDVDFKDELFQLIREYDENIADNIDEKVLLDVSSNILAVLQVPDYQIFFSILAKKLEAEFNGQVSNIFNANLGELQLDFKGMTILAEIKDKSIIRMSKNVFLPFNADVVYIDDPFVLEDYTKSLPPFFYGLYDHQSYLRSKLSRFNIREGNVIEEILVNEKLKNIYDKIASVCSGEVVFDKPQAGYRSKGSEKTLNLHNLSTGLKTFVILKMLLLNRTLASNGVLILDEPEIHLHPEWQLLFAEIIVLLQKEFGLYVLLNTHSPYFLRALEVYAAKHKVIENCKFYLSENRDNGSVISDVTDDIERIYEKLARPLQTLENERWNDAATE